jgi:hypothetical protein
MGRYLTPDEKATTLRRWEETKAAFAAGKAAGTIRGETAGYGYPDVEMYATCDALNAIEGVCTAQSCSGHRVAYDDHGQVMANGEHVGPTLWSGVLWIKLDEAMHARFVDQVWWLAERPGIERVSLLLGEWCDGDVAEVVFAGLNAGETRDDGLRQLEASRSAIVKFFETLRRAGTIHG